MLMQMMLPGEKKFTKVKVVIAKEAIKYTNAPWKINTVKKPMTAYFFNRTFR